MASTAVVDFANFVPQEVRVLTEEEYNDENAIEETYRVLASHGITRENICILTDYSPALTMANKQIILQRYNDENEARKHLMQVNHLVEYIVIDCYGENDIDIPVERIVQYIGRSLMRMAGIDILTDLFRLTNAQPELTSDAEDNIIDVHGPLRGPRLVERINNLLTFLYDYGWDHLFNPPDDYDPTNVNKVNLTPYTGAVENGCPICFDDNTVNLVSTPCKHIYHTACIEEWLKTHNTCPLCRKQI